MNSSKQVLSRLFLFACFSFLLIAGFGCSGDNPEALFQQGVDAVEAGKPDEAVIWFKKALQEDPEMAIAHYKLGEVYHKKGEVRLAYAELSRAVQQDTKLKDARKELAFLLIENRGLEQAVKVCQQYLEVNGDDEDIYLILANSLAYTNNLDEAVTLLEKAAAIYPKNIIIQINLAKLLIVSGDTGKARTLLETLAEERGEEIKVQLALAQLYQKIERYDLAVLALESIIKKFPESPLPYLAMAQLSLKKKKPERAKTILLDAEKKGVHDSKIYRMIGMIDHRMGNSESALNNFKKAVDSANVETRQQNMMILADYYSYLKKYKEAQDTLQTIIAEDSSKKALKSKVVELFMAQGEYDQARSSVDALLQEDSGDARGHFLKGLMMMQDKDVLAARKEFSEAKDLAPNAAENQFLYGVTFMKESEQISMTEISEALKKNPNLMKARMALAELYAKKGDYQQSLEELDTILARQKESNQLDKIAGKQADMVKVRVLRLSLLMKLKQADTALVDAKLLVEQFPDTASHKFRLAEIYFQLKQFDKALPLYEELQKEKPDSIKLLQRIVGIFMLKKQPDNGMETVDGFLAKYPDNIQAVLVKARIYLSQGHNMLAENILVDAAAKGKEVGPNVMLAELYSKDGDMEKAVLYYKKALEIQPDSIAIQMKLADLYLTTGENENAIAEYEKVLKLKSDFLPAMNNLAYLYSEDGGNLDRALELATAVYAKLPTNPDVLDTLGWIYVKKNVYSQAEPYLQEAYSKKSENPSINYHLGMMFFKQHKTEDAKKSLHSAVEKGLAGNELIAAKKSLAAIEGVTKKVTIAEEAFAKGDTATAINLFETLLADDGFNATAAAHLAVLYAERNKDIVKALDLAQKAYDTQAGNPLTADALGWVYYYQGSQLMAKQYLEQAIEYDDGYAPAYIHLAAVYQKKEDPENAAKMISKAKKLDMSPADRELLKKIEM